MKAILVIDVPVLDDGRHLCNECPIWNKERLFCEYDFNMEAKGCPLKHPLKYASNDFYIYDTKYLMENLDREINLLKGTKALEEIMENKNESIISGRCS